MIIGENRSFDHVFATYQPKAIKGRPQEVLNLLSEGIISLKGTNAVPGPNWERAVQKQVSSQESVFTLSPPSTDYKTLPNPLAGGPAGQFANLTGICTTLAQCTGFAEEVETGLPDASYYESLASGGTGLTSGTPDTRIQWDGHSVTGQQPAARSVPADQRDVWRTRPTPQAPCIASTRCSSSSTATPRVGLAQPLRLQRQAVRVGRNHLRRGLQR